jgi:hypothetical protein
VGEFSADILDGWIDSDSDAVVAQLGGSVLALTDAIAASDWLFVADCARCSIGFAARVRKSRPLNQSIDPSQATSAADLQSPMSAQSSIREAVGVLVGKVDDDFDIVGLMFHGLQPALGRNASGDQA